MPGDVIITTIPRPAPGVVGRMHLPAIGPYISRDTGTEWENWGMVTKMTPPSLGDFLWFNQGTHIVNTNPSGSLTLFHPGAAGVAFNWGSIVKPVPATNPYTIVAGVSGHVFDKAASLGICLVDGNTGKMVVFSSGVSDAGNPSIAGWKMNSPTSYNSAYFTYNASALAYGGLLARFWRIRETGTNRIVSISHDREVWLTIAVIPANDFLVPTHFGYCLRGTGNGVASLMTIYHESVTLT